MGIWTDLAIWVGPTPNRGGAIVNHLYVVEHIADGTFAGTISWQKNASANVSSHFIVAKDGRIAQMVDTSQQAWTQILGNPYSISIENEGFSGEALTPAQMEASARLLVRANQVHGIPLQVTGTVGIPGLGHHSMGYESGVNWGHQFCPGNAIKAQKPTIVARAYDIAGGEDMPGYAASQPEWVDDDIWRGSAMAHGANTIEGGRYKGQEHWLVATVRDIQTAVHTPATAAAQTEVDLDSLAERVAARLSGIVPSLEDIEEAAYRGANRPPPPS
jgi:hypothetical protein